MIKFSQENKELMAKMYKDGYSAQKIADNYNLSTDTILKVLKAMNVEIRTHGKLNASKREEIVRLYNNGVSAQDIADIFNVSQTTILTALRKENIKIRSIAGTKELNLDTNYIAKLYDSGKSAYEIQSIVGCKAVNSIYNIIRECCEIRNGIDRAEWTKNIKKDFFKEPLSERAQYWIGFLFADGSVYYAKEHRCNLTLTIEVGEKDGWILEEFKKDLGIKNVIQKRDMHDGRIHKRIQFSCKEITDSLAKYGIIPNKTYLSQSFFADSKTLTGHMLRGFLDGDGWVTLDKFTKESSGRVGFIGNWYSINNLRDILHNKLGLREDLPVYCDAEKNRWPRIVYTRISDITKLFEFMYPEDTTLFLPRKKDKFLILYKNRLERNLLSPWPSCLEMNR